MRFSIAVALFSSVSSVLAASHLVLVGDNDTLTFSPNQLQVAEGDTVSFEFRSKNHSVTQSTFAAPCALMTTPTVGVDSGFQFTSNDTTTFAQWTITIDNASTPLWFFCAQTTPANHCQNGMVFAINPSATKTFDAYLANAQNVSNPVGVPTNDDATTGAVAATTAAVAGATSSGFVTSAAVAATQVAGAVGSAAASLVTSLGSIAATAIPSPAAGLAASDTTAPSTSGAIRIGTGLSGLVTFIALISTLMF